MNHDVVNKVIRRLVIAYGEPQIENPDDLFEEFSKALAGTRGDILTKGVDLVIRERVFPGWPTVGEVVKACRSVAQENARPEIEKPVEHREPSPEERERVSTLLRSVMKTLDAGNSFAEIRRRCPMDKGATIDVSAPWGEEVRDGRGNIVPIQKRREAAA